MVTLRILGECAIEVGSTTLGPDSQVLFGTLLYLALDAGRRVPRREMTDVLWPGADEDAARHNLRQAVYRLRQMGATVETDGGHVAMPAGCVAAPHEGLATEAGVEAIFSRSAPPVGPVLPGYQSGLSDRLDEWVDQQRTLIHGRIRRALVASMERFRARGRWGEVEVLARKILVFDPLNEEATLVLAESAALSGSKQYALTILDRYLAELGPEAGEIRLPAAVLRRRISERLPEPRWRAVSEAAFVGRAESMELLGRLLQGARNGEGSGVLLWGEPGIGKTRLAEELWKVAALQSRTQLAKVCCQPSDARRPLSVFADVVPDLQRMPGAIGCAPRSLALLKRLTEYDVRAEGPSEDAREAEYLYASVRRAIFDLLDAVQEDQCLVLVVEDVHWLDAESWRVLREMIPWAARRRILFVLTSRTPHATDTPDEEWPKFLVKHRVGPIDADAAVTLVELMVRERERVPDEAFRDWSVSVAEGNPFFLRELTTYWLQTGAAYQIPASLQALIDDRLDKLSTVALRSLQTIAILGKNGTLPRLERALELQSHLLIDAVNELAHAGMVRLSGAQLSPTHETLARSSVERLSQAARALIHRRAAQAIEVDALSTQQSLIWDCATHWRAAGDQDRAFALMRTTVECLFRLGLPEEAVDILKRLLASTAQPSRRCEVLSTLGRALAICGQWPVARDHFEEASALAAIGACTQHEQHFDEALYLDARIRAGEELDSVLSFAESRAADLSLPPSVRLRAARVAIACADSCAAFARMHAVYSCILTIPTVTPDDRATIGVAKTIYFATCGDPSIAVTAASDVVSVYARHGDLTPALARSELVLGHALQRAGRLDEAKRTFLQTAHLAHHYRIRAYEAWPYVSLAMLSLSENDLATATLYRDKAEEAVRAADERVWREELKVLSARVALAQGDVTRAAELVKPLSGALLSDTTLRRRLALEAIWVDIAIRRAESLAESEIWRDFVRTLRLLVTHSNVDYPVSVLIRGLRALGQWAQSTEALQRYVEIERRELGPPPAMLQGLLE
jgi:DNA-binding SARP family transcriptional activator